MSYFSAFYSYVTLLLVSHTGPMEQPYLKDSGPTPGFDNSSPRPGFTLLSSQHEENGEYHVESEFYRK